MMTSGPPCTAETTANAPWQSAASAPDVAHVEQSDQRSEAAGSAHERDGLLAHVILVHVLAGASEPMSPAR
jgi:hypothetical protein